MKIFTLTAGSIFLFGGFLYAENNLTEIMLNPTPKPSNPQNKHYNMRMEKESFVDMNARYRDCMNKNKDKAMCENMRSEPNDKFVVEYK